jgi:hypothetical protein
MKVKVTYNHSYPLFNREHEWHNFDKSAIVDVAAFTDIAIQEAIDKKEGSGDNTILKCMPHGEN